MSGDIKVSVVVPIYGVEKYLNQCVDSILAQTLKEIEVILVDDGSKDRCPEIVDEYAKKDSRVVAVHQPNGGYGRAVNHGIELARGEYIGIVESDDWIEPDMYSTLYAKAKKYDVDVVKSNFYGYIAKTNTNTKVIVIPTEDEKKVICPRQFQRIFWSMPCIWAAIYKKDFLYNNHIMFLETPGASYQDTSFNFKVWAMSEKVYLFSDAFLHYRQDNENSSVNSPQKVFCVCDEYREIERFSKLNRQVYDELKYLIPRLKYATYQWNFERLTFPLNWNFLRVYSKEFLLYLHEHLIDKNLFDKKLYKKVRKLAYHPCLFLFSYYLRKVKKCLHH